MRKKEVVGYAVTALVLVSCSVLSLQRSILWKSTASLGEDVVAQYPLHLRGLGYQQLKANNVGNYARSLSLRPQADKAFKGLREFNAANSYRKYEFGLPHLWYANFLHNDVKAMAELNGLEAGIRHAESLIAEMGERYPKRYLKTETKLIFTISPAVLVFQGPDPKNPLVRKRNQLLQQRAASQTAAVVPKDF